MGRSKVKLAYIENKSDRKTTYGKRSKCLLKKTSELSTLCDVQACAILYGPYSETPEVWPSREGAQEVVARFRNMPEYQQVVNKKTLESFTKEKIKKEEEKLKKYRKQNFRKNLSNLMNKRMRGDSTKKASLEELQEMRSISVQKMREIAVRLEELKLAEKVKREYHEA